MPAHVDRLATVARTGARAAVAGLVAPPACRAVAGLVALPACHSDAGAGCPARGCHERQAQLRARHNRTRTRTATRPAAALAGRAGESLGCRPAVARQPGCAHHHRHFPTARAWCSASTPRHRASRPGRWRAPSPMRWCARCRENWTWRSRCMAAGCCTPSPRSPPTPTRCATAPPASAALPARRGCCRSWRAACANLACAW